MDKHCTEAKEKWIKLMEEIFKKGEVSLGKVRALALFSV